MLNDYIVWNGISSEDFDGLYIKKTPALNRPRPKMTVQSIDGKNGQIVFPQGVYENYDQDYQLFFYASKKHGTIAEQADKIAEWLYEPQGYAELRDSFQPDIVRYAYLQYSVDIVNQLSFAGTAKITFSCRPERFLLSGLQETKYIESPATVYNPTKFASRPVIKVNLVDDVPLNASSRIRINGMDVSVSSYGTGLILKDFVIDCENMNVYSKDGDNYNLMTNFSELKYPELNPGMNLIRFGVDIGSSFTSNIVVTPRWWII